jgi:hypothetical protein
MAVSDIETTWGADAQFDHLQLESNDDLYQSLDLWGTLITEDTSDTDQTVATISYPDDQVFAQLYVAENSAAITSTGTGSSTGIKSLGSVIYKDTEIASVSRNLIVVGGSCVNSVAATLLGSATPLCGAAFTAKTGVSSNQYLIQTFSRTGDKVATLVAGFNAADTTNAATYFTKQPVDTTVGKKYVGTSATVATASTVTA